MVHNNAPTVPVTGVTFISEELTDRQQYRQPSIQRCHKLDGESINGWENGVTVGMASRLQATAVGDRHGCELQQ